MNIQNNVNTPNFNAKMNVKSVRIDKARWQNVAKIFEQNTAKQESDTVVFELSSYMDPKNVWIDAEELSCSFIGCNYYDEIMKFSDKQIAGMFKKLYTLMKKPHDVAYKLTKQVEKYSQNQYIDGEDLGSKVYSEVHSTLQNQSKDAISKDKMLSKLYVELY